MATPLGDSEAQTFGPVDRRPDALGDFRVLPDELVCSILEFLTPRDVARLACVSSVMYVLCNEEPLWMSQCLNSVNGPLQYKGSWKNSALHLEHLPSEHKETYRRPLSFDGFNSLFLYRRFYRCHTTLEGFYVDSGDIERRKDLSLQEFLTIYDGKKPVLVAGLADTWPARCTWTVDQLLLTHGDTTFKISQRSSRKISMKFKDYASYMKLQKDEDPLYIFDDKFGEVAPDLLKDYNVPHLFQEDFFDVLDREQRPPFRWLIIGPERSGASWHVDPALTSAWNTLLCGRKRWALYPPGRVPLGVTVHVNEEDGDVNIDTPSSLQWWLDFYPLLADEDRPIECTQLPGETIYVPSGWWHCVLNLEPTIAVTQNFVNSNNFEFVCLDMAPGYRHKGVCRAGLLALDGYNLEDAENNISDVQQGVNYSDLTRKEKRIRINKIEDDPSDGNMSNGASKYHTLWKHGISYDVRFLATFLDDDRDHYNAPWSSGNCMGQRELRAWLSKLWVEKPGMRELTWKGACLALNASKWSDRLAEICVYHSLPAPKDDERLPVGTGSNPVYLMDDFVIKIFVEEGLEASLYGLGTELEFYSLLCKVKSPLKDRIPYILASGILYLEKGSYTIVPWDGKEFPGVIANCKLIPERKGDGFPFGVWSKKYFELRKAGLSAQHLLKSPKPAKIWPFIITKRCSGKIYGHLRDMLSWEETLNLASFLGEQLHDLHLLPIPPSSDSIFSDAEEPLPLSFTSNVLEAVPDLSNIPANLDIFLNILRRKRMDASSRLKTWEVPIPSSLTDKIDEYLPDDLVKLLNVFEDENGTNEVYKGYSWIHSDIMDDNIQMELYLRSCSSGNAGGCKWARNGLINSDNGNEERKSWRPSHILDFSDLSIGDPICDLIPIYLDVFRGDNCLLKQFLESYKLPLVGRVPQQDSGDNKFGRLSYRAMCYCILHEENILGAICSIWEELKMAKSWEEIELAVWGELNNYKGFT